MKSKTRKPVVIIGAGIAGLTAADYLNRKKVPFILFESNEQIAGLCRSFKDAEGFSHDFGAHFVTNRLASAIGVPGECQTVKRYGESVWYGGRRFSYPFGIACRPRFALSALRGRLGQAFSKNHEPRNAAEWFRSRYGKAFADRVALPLVESWSGCPAEELAPSVGSSLPRSVTKTFYLKAAAKVLGRAVACGYSRELPESHRVWHVYPKHGVATLCEKLAETIQGQIKLKTPVEEIIVENERAVGVRAGGEFFESAAVVSTAPVNVLPKIVRGTDSLDEMREFEYRPLTLVNLRLKGRGLLPNVVVWFPGNQFPFYRLTEAPLSMPWLAPEGCTTITVDMGCQLGDRIWTMGEEEMTEFCLRSLEAIIPGVRQRYLGCRVMRTPVGYPVYRNNYEPARNRLMQGLPVRRLVSIGRNGEFSHMLMEDVYWRTRKKMGELLEILNREGVKKDNRRKSRAAVVSS